MKTILKIIGTVLWAISGLTLSFALMLHYGAGFNGNQNVFTFLLWVFLIVFTCYTPWYLGTVFSNTLFKREADFNLKLVELNEKINVYDQSAVRHSNAAKRCFKDLQEMKAALGYKTKQEKVKEVDTLFNNVPLDYPTNLIREKVLTYIRENG